MPSLGANYEKISEDWDRASTGYLLDNGQAWDWFYCERAISRTRNIIDNSCSHWLNYTITDLVDKQFLDQGTFGKVYSATIKTENRRVAVKVLQATADNEEKWKREAKLLQ